MPEQKMKAAVFFITGTSGSGKSTLVKLLKKELPLVEVHDFDEGGVPEGADEKWRRKRTEKWVKKARIYRQTGKSTVICGVSVPAEVRGSSAYDRSLNVNFGFIHVNEGEIRRRLASRGWGRLRIQDNINWAKHLEKCVKAEKNHIILSGEKNPPKRLTEKFVEWIYTVLPR